MPRPRSGIARWASNGVVRRLARSPEPPRSASPYGVRGALILERGELPLVVVDAGLRLHRACLAVDPRVDVEVDALDVPRGRRKHDDAVDVARLRRLRGELELLRRQRQGHVGREIAGVLAGDVPLQMNLAARPAERRVPARDHGERLREIPVRVDVEGAPGLLPRARRQDVAAPELDLRRVDVDGSDPACLDVHLRRELLTRERRLHVPGDVPGVAGGDLDEIERDPTVRAASHYAHVRVERQRPALQGLLEVGQPRDARQIDPLGRGHDAKRPWSPRQGGRHRLSHPVDPRSVHGHVAAVEGHAVRRHHGALSLPREGDLQWADRDTARHVEVGARVDVRRVGSPDEGRDVGRGRLAGRVDRRRVEAVPARHDVPGVDRDVDARRRDRSLGACRDRRAVDPVVAPHEPVGLGVELCFDRHRADVELPRGVHAEAAPHGVAELRYAIEVDRLGGQVEVDGGRRPLRKRAKVEVRRSARLVDDESRVGRQLPRR